MPSTMHVVIVVLAGPSVRNILGGGGNWWCERKVKVEASCSLAADHAAVAGFNLRKGEASLNERISRLTHVSAGDAAQTGDTSDANVRAPHMAAAFFVVRPTASGCNKVIIA